MKMVFGVESSSRLRLISYVNMATVFLIFTGGLTRMRMGA